MKFKLLSTFLFALLFFACQKNTLPMISMPKEVYKFVKSASEDFEKVNKLALKSKNTIEIDMESGKFSGTYNSIDFEGKFDILKVNSMLSKGFSYKVSLGYLSKSESSNQDDERFFNILIQADKISIVPEKLIQPKFVKLNISSEALEKSLNFVKLN